MIMEKAASLVNLLISIVMGIVLGVAGQLLQGSFSALAFCQSFILSMGVGYLIGSFIPIMDIGKSIAHWLGAKAGIAEYIISSFVVAVVMVILITFFCMFVQAGSEVFAVFGQIIGPFLIIGTLAIELSLHWLIRFAVKYNSK